MEGSFLEYMLGVETVLDSFVLERLTMGIAVSGLLTGPAETVWDLFVLSCAFLWDG